MSFNNSAARVAALVVLVSGFASNSAHAVFRPGWERPVQAAQLTIFNTTGSLDYVKTLKATTTGQDGLRRYTGIALEINGVERSFEVTSVKVGSCGSTLISAKADVWAADGGPRWITTVTIQDNSTRLCRDMRRGVWELEMKIFKEHHGSKVLSGKLSAYGNPEDVITAQ